MSGKHSAGHAGAPVRGSRGGGRRLLVSGGVILAVLAVIGTATAVALRGRDDRKAAVPASATCSGSVAVPVVVSPAIESTTRAITTRWLGTHPATSGTCITVAVTGQESAVAERGIAGTAPRAMVWIPDSSLWAGVLGATPTLASSVQVGAPVATSPLVLATGPGQAAALSAVAKSGWAAAMTGAVPVTIPDPTTTTAGALIALALQSQIGTGPGASAKLVGTFVRLAGSTITSSKAGIADLAAHPASAPAFVASERDVFAGNQGKAAAVATAVYPSGPSPVLDFPVVTVAPAKGDPKVLAAAKLLEQQLTSPQAQQQFAEAGLRDPSGAPLPPGAGISGIASKAVSAAPAPSAAKLASAARLWKAAVKPSTLLAVIDVSGSMADPAGNGQSKIATAAAAAQTAIGLMPDSWTLGLWSFSYHEPPLTDFTELAPLGKVAQQRKALNAAAATLPAQTGGNTALYDTALAAFENSTKHYDPANVNVVALLTDGTDVDPDGMDLPTLLGKLKAQFDPAHPVKIVTIGVGAGADIASLKQISAVTTGQSYVVNDPADIRGVLLDSIIANN